MLSTTFTLVLLFTLWLVYWRYTVFWVLLIVTKLTFSYYLEVLLFSFPEIVSVCCLLKQINRSTTLFLQKLYWSINYEVKFLFFSLQHSKLVHTSIQIDTNTIKAEQNIFGSRLVSPMARFQKIKNWIGWSFWAGLE